MKKFIASSAIATSILACAFAQEDTPPVNIQAFKSLPSDFQTPHRHGVYIGAEASYLKARAYDCVKDIHTGSSMPGLHVGYLYEAPTGVCWRVSTRYNKKRSDSCGKRDASHFAADVRYRFPMEGFTLSPILGIKSELNSLDKYSDWHSQSSQVYLGAEALFQVTPDITAAIEVKGKTSYSHYIVVRHHKQFAGEKQTAYHGIEADLPVRINIAKDPSRQVELRPTYHYESYKSGNHKIGMQAHLIQWF